MRSVNKRTFSWTQFLVGFPIAFGTCFISMIPFDSVVVHVGISLGVALIFAFLAGRFGDDAWHWFVTILPW